MSGRVAVFGASGQLGTEIVKELGRRKYDVLAWTRGQVDITDPAQVESALAKTEAEVVINTSAYNHVDIAEQEPQAAYLVNALGVRNPALVCRQIDASLVHFSTDYVFDGLAGRPYTEDDPTHPLGAYAVSKLAGELYAQAYLDSVLIVRTSGVFGPGGLATARGNFVELMLRLAGSGKPIRVVEDHIASPTYAPLLAARTIDLVDRRQSGIFHIGGGLPVSWFDFARMIFEAAGLRPSLKATNEREYRTQAHRPRYSALSNGKMERLGLPAMPPLREALESYFASRGRTVSETPA
jgi:dTDP-4-dehydrorhamnose reductase